MRSHTSFGGVNNIDQCSLVYMHGWVSSLHYQGIMVSEVFADRLHGVTDQFYKVNDRAHEVTDRLHQCCVGPFGFI